MEIMTIECPKCGGKLHVDQDTAKCFCMYCRAEVIVKEAQSTDSTNHEYKAKFAIAQHTETLYMKDQKAFTEVLAAFDDVRLVGAHHAEYWISRSRFFAKGVIRECGRGRMKLSKRKAAIEQYTLWMDTAADHYQGLVEKIEAEKKRTIIEINTAFDEYENELEKKRQSAEEECERKRQLALKVRATNATERAKILIIVSIVVPVAVIVIFFGILIARMLLSHVEEATERQAIWNSIEERIEAGYDSWDELILWADEVGIPWVIHEGGERPKQGLMDAINHYGLVGDYLKARPGTDDLHVGTFVLVLHWENVSHNEVVEELYHLDRYSEDVLIDWLDAGGLEQLEEHFGTILVQKTDGSHRYLTEDTLRRKELISWIPKATIFNAPENASIHIYIRYRFLESSKEAAHRVVLDLVNAKDRNEYMELIYGEMQRSNTVEMDWFADWLGVDRELLGNYFSVRILLRDAEGNAIPQEVPGFRIVNGFDEDSFVSWDFGYFITRDDRLGIEIFKRFDLEIDRSGITFNNFNAIQEGMTLDEVAALLGGSGVVSSASGSFEMRTWQRSTTSSVHIIAISFQDGRVTSKSQTGW